MSKGRFDTPQPLGTVDEIRITAVKVKSLTDTSGFQIHANLDEGNDVAGTFEVKDTGTMSILESELSVSDQTLLNNFLKLILREYIGAKGYTGIIIT